jgi:uncharacterized Ntn-hydrolase superfamily protein
MNGLCLHEGRYRLETGATPVLSTTRMMAMTFSIIARCPETGSFGIAAATGMPGVGKLLTHARSRVGAVATQGLLNPYHGLDGIEALTSSALHPVPVTDLLNRMMHFDADRDRRQVAMIDAGGETAVWTGSNCKPWAGSRQGPGYAIQGNLLPGPEVLEACEETFQSSADLSFSMRLLMTLEAGEAAGGDKRGTQSATLYIVEEEDYPLWDIRIDHHHEPLPELRRVYDLFATDMVPHIKAMPSRDARRPRIGPPEEPPC